MVAGWTKLVQKGIGPTRRINKILIALDSESRLKVSLVRQQFLQPAYVAQGDRSSVVTYP